MRLYSKLATISLRELLILKNQSGFVIQGCHKNRRCNAGHNGLIRKNPKFQFLRTSSTNSISKTNENVNQNSLSKANAESISSDRITEGAYSSGGAKSAINNVKEYANNEAKIYDNRVIEIEELTVVGGVDQQSDNGRQSGSTSPAVSSKDILSIYSDLVNYDIDPIKMVEGARNSAPTTTKVNLTQSGSNVNQNSLSKANAESTSADRITEGAYSSGGTKSAINSASKNIIDAESKKVNTDYSLSKEGHDETKNTTRRADVEEAYAGMDTVIGQELQNLESSKKQLVESALLRIGEEFGVFGDYGNADMEVTVSFSRGSLKESAHKSITDGTQLAKLIPMLNSVVESAVGIETHDNRYYGDDQTKYFHELLGGYVDGNNLVPVRFGIKEFNNGSCRLYIIVSQEKIKTGVMVSEHMDNSSGDPDARPVKLSIAQIAQNVNSPDLLRYLPDGLLNETQKEIKYQALAETVRYTNNKNDEAYTKALAKGDMATVQRMVDKAAQLAGYATKAYHGTKKESIPTVPSANNDLSNTPKASGGTAPISKIAQPETDVNTDYSLSKEGQEANKKHRPGQRCEVFAWRIYGPSKAKLGQ